MLSNLLKSLISILLGKGLSVGSYERVKSGRWPAISIAMLPLVLDDTKLERMWSIQLVVDSVTRVASRIKGLKPSEWIKLRYSFAIVLLTSVLMLKSPKIRHFLLDKKTECRTFSNSSIKSRCDPLGGL